MRLIVAVALSLFLAATQAAAQTAGIISKDTTWQAGSTITLTGNIQVAHGSTLTIGQGAVINANGFDIQIFGTIKALGTQFSKITINNGVFKFGANHLTNGRMELAYSKLIGGKFLPATGNESYGSFQVTDSIFSSVSGFYIWYPTSESSFVRNSFFDSDGLSIGTRHNVTVRNNLFLLSKATVRGVKSAVESWATYDGANVSVSQNSIYVSSGYALALSIDGSMSANNNYFGTDDESEIALLVLDKADSLNLGSFINTSYLKTPHPDTPVNTPPVVAITGGNRTVADTNGAAGESVALTATASDGDGAIATTQWLVNGQVVATGATANLSLVDGATTVTFRATDNSGATTSTTATITVLANRPPAASIVGGSRTIADTNNTQGETVTLTATATDSDGSIASTQWLVAGQVVATGTSASLALADGATTVTFRATDDRGATISTSAVITIGESQAERSEYLGTYNGVAVDPRYNLEVNQVGLIIIDRSRLHSCVKIFENSKPAQVAGMNKIDVTFNILSLDTGAIQIVATRPFSDQSSTDAQPAECSGRFETTTGIYRDYINLGSQLFDASFRLVNDITLEFSLVDAQEVLIKN